MLQHVIPAPILVLNRLQRRQRVAEVLATIRYASSVLSSYILRMLPLRNTAGQMYLGVVALPPRSFFMVPLIRLSLVS